MFNTSIIPTTTPEYQSRLDRFNDPPKKLFLRGQHDFSAPAIAIVGSRKHSTYGAVVTKNLVKSLVGYGVTIISGMALGIDGIAHTAAVEFGGTTTAILPGGLKQIYPASHRQLAERILKSGGGLISEYPDYDKPLRHYFVARNRLVAGLADAVVVIEAASRSGTLITAEFALDMGIPVLAVPGPINSLTSAGTNRLIQTGAAIVTCVEDILQEIGLDTVSTDRQLPLLSSTIDKHIIDHLRLGPATGTTLQNKLDIGSNELSQRLTHLELAGHISCLSDGIWSLR